MNTKCTHPAITDGWALMYLICAMKLAGEEK